MNPASSEKICVIIAGGDVTGRIEIPEGALVLCADCGYAHARRQGITPDVLIGDFDSFTDALPEGIEILRLPVEKDVTDTFRCVQYGEEHGFTRFHIYGAIGGERIDHSIASLQMLRYLYERGDGAILYHGNKYETDRITLTSSFPLGVSNCITADCAEITAESGLLLIVQVRK